MLCLASCQVKQNIAGSMGEKAGRAIEKMPSENNCWRTDSEAVTIQPLNNRII